MQRIEEMSDADISEVEASASLFHEGSRRRPRELRSLLDTLCGVELAGRRHEEEGARGEFEAPLVGAFALGEEEAFALLTDGPDRVDPAATRSGSAPSGPPFSEMWRSAREIAGRERFLHWQAAFPGVWQGWQDDRPKGGFDAVIGNPPWDRIKLQEKEWFEFQEPRIAKLKPAAKRNKEIREILESNSPLALAFSEAKERAQDLREIIKASGALPFAWRRGHEPLLALCRARLDFNQSTRPCWPPHTFWHLR